MKHHSDIWDITEEKTPAYFDLAGITDARYINSTQLHLWQMVALETLQQPKLTIKKRTGGTVFINPIPDDVQPALPDQTR